MRITKYNNFYLLFTLIIIATSLIYANDLFFVKNQNVKIYSGPSANNKTIGLLQKNQQVVKLSENGKFFSVKNDKNITGWVYSFYLTKTQAAQTDKSKSAIDALTKDNYASRNGSTTINARGLTEMSEAYAKNRFISKQSVQQAKELENYKISDADLENFLKAGKLGEYAE